MAKEHMAAKVIVEFTIRNLCSESDLTDMEMTFEELTKYEIEEEGLFGIIDDDYKILSIEEIE
jgi:hypothetical protein